MLFNRSVQDNIRYNTDESFLSIVEAAKIANAYDFIENGNFGIQKSIEEKVKMFFPDLFRSSNLFPSRV